MIDRFLSPVVFPFFKTVADKIIAGGLSFNKLLIATTILSLTGCFLAAMQVYIPALIFMLLARFAQAVLEQARSARDHSIFAVFSSIGFLASFVFFISAGFLSPGISSIFLIFALCLVGMARMAQTLADVPRRDFAGHGEIAIFLTLCCLFPQSFAWLATLFGFVWIVGAGLQLFQLRRLT